MESRLEMYFGIRSSEPALSIYSTLGKGQFEGYKQDSMAGLRAGFRSILVWQSFWWVRQGSLKALLDPEFLLDFHLKNADQELQFGNSAFLTEVSQKSGLLRTLKKFW